MRLDATPTAQHLVPRFSPSGARVAWIDVANPSSQVITAALDGSARHVVRTVAKLKTAPPQWLDETHVAWVEDTSANATPHLQIVSAVDADAAGDGAGRSVIVNCDPTADANAMQVINQFENVGGAWIATGGIKSRTANPPGATILYRLAGSSCSTMTATVLADEPAGGFAWDFAVSPDGATLAVAAAEAPGSSAHDIFLVPVDGSVPPSRFVGSSPGFDDIGPTWLADGKQLSWTQASTDGTATGGGIMIANRDGSNVRSALPEGGSTTATTFVVAPTNRGLDCSVAGGGSAARRSAAASGRHLLAPSPARMTTRCSWVSDDPLYVDYHDREWGVPEWDDRALWEKLILDGFQAGLSWITILRKRENFRARVRQLRSEEGRALRRRATSSA